MTPAHEALYLRTLHALVAIGVDFCVIGTFALRLQCPALPRRLVADCDLMLPRNPVSLTELVHHLQTAGWQITLWDEPIQRPITAKMLTGKYYLRARQADAVLDCSYENDYLSWDEFTTYCQWQQGLPLLVAEQIILQKTLLNKPAGREIIQLYQEITARNKQSESPVA